MKEAFPEIGFADSTYKYSVMSGKTLMVFINSWNGREIKIEFSNIILYNYRIGSFIDGVYEESDDGSFLTEAILLYYSEIPESHKFKIFTILDIEDSAIYRVVAESATATKT